MTILLTLDMLNLFNCFLKVSYQKMIWEKVFKSGLSKFSGRQPLNNLNGYNLLKRTSTFHKLYLVHSWILCPIWSWLNCVMRRAVFHFSWAQPVIPNPNIIKRSSSEVYFESLCNASKHVMIPTNTMGSFAATVNA